jgi:hypothetical protein
LVAPNVLDERSQGPRVAVQQAPDEEQGLAAARNAERNGPLLCPLGRLCRDEVVGNGCRGQTHREHDGTCGQPGLVRAIERHRRLLPSVRTVPVPETRTMSGPPVRITVRAGPSDTVPSKADVSASGQKQEWRHHGSCPPGRGNRWEAAGRSRVRPGPPEPLKLRRRVCCAQVRGRPGSGLSRRRHPACRRSPRHFSPEPGSSRIERAEKCQAARVTRAA